MASYFLLQNQSSGPAPQRRQAPSSLWPGGLTVPEVRPAWRSCSSHFLLLQRLLVLWAGDTPRASYKETLCLAKASHQLALPGFPWWLFPESTCQCRRRKRCEFDPWVGKIPWRRAWQPTPVFLPGESYGQRSLVAYRVRKSWGHSWSYVAAAAAACLP